MLLKSLFFWDFENVVLSFVPSFVVVVLLFFVGLWEGALTLFRCQKGGHFERGGEIRDETQKGSKFEPETRLREGQ